MAKKRFAKKAARRKSRAVYKTNIRKPKRQVVKKFANFVGKSTFMKVLKKPFRRFKKRRNRRSRRRRRRYR